MRTRSQALAFMKARMDSASYDQGACLQAVDDAYNVPWPRSHDAAQAFSKTTRPCAPVPGVPVWWTGGSHGYGHVAVALSATECYTTDFSDRGYLGDGRIHRCYIASISRAVPSLTYRGATQDIESHLIQEDEVPQFTDEQARQLKDFIDALAATGATPRDLRYVIEFKREHEKVDHSATIHQHEVTGTAK